MSSFKPVQIELVREEWGWHVDESGKWYSDGDLFFSREDAVANGRERVAAMTKRYESLGQSISKKTRALDAAEKT